MDHPPPAAQSAQKPRLDCRHHRPAPLGAELDRIEADLLAGGLPPADVAAQMDHLRALAGAIPER